MIQGGDNLLGSNHAQNNAQPNSVPVSRGDDMSKLEYDRLKSVRMSFDFSLGRMLAVDAVPFQIQVRQLEDAWVRAQFPLNKWADELLLMTDKDIRNLIIKRMGQLNFTYEGVVQEFEKIFDRQEDDIVRFRRTIGRPRPQGQPLLAYVIQWEATAGLWEQHYESLYWKMFKDGARVNYADEQTTPRTWEAFHDRARTILEIYIERHGDPSTTEKSVLDNDRKEATTTSRTENETMNLALSPPDSTNASDAEAGLFLRMETTVNQTLPRDVRVTSRESQTGKRGKNRSRDQGNPNNVKRRNRFSCAIHQGDFSHKTHECPMVIQLRDQLALNDNMRSVCTVRHFRTIRPQGTLYMFPFVLTNKAGKRSRVAGLVDTGATYSLIDADLARSLDCKPFCIPHMPIISPLGASTGSSLACSFTIALNSWLAIAEAIILPGLKNQLFLGANFIPKNGGVFDPVRCTFAGHPSLGLSPTPLRVLAKRTKENEPQGGMSILGVLRTPTRGDSYSVHVSATEERQLDESLIASLVADNPECLKARKRVFQRFGKLFKDALEWGHHVSDAIKPYQIRLMKGATGTKLPQFRLTLEEHEEVNRTIREWLAQGIIERSNSPFNVAMFLVDKDGGKAKRLVLNFKPLNEITENPFSYLPITEDILARIGADRPVVFAKIDLTLGYLQVPLSRESRELTAFSSQLGHFHFIRLPFGLALAPTFFHTMIIEIMDELLSDKVAVYLDDLIMWGSSVEELQLLVMKVLKRMEEYDLVLHTRKCEFFVSRVKFLGHTLSDAGISPDENKIRTIQNWPVPSTVHDCQVFLGLANYLRKFIKDFSAVARPINDFVAGRVETFGSDQVKAFRNLQEIITLAGTLVYPDRKQLFELETDASQVQAGAILFIRDRDTRRRLGPVGYFSRSFNDTERRYSARDREIYAIVLACEHWRYILAGLRFVVYTDHKSLALPIAPAGRIAGFIDRLSPFTFTTKWRSGALNAGADALSRIPEITVAPMTAQPPSSEPTMEEPTSEDAVRYDEPDSVFLDGIVGPGMHNSDGTEYETIRTLNPPPFTEEAARELVARLRLTTEELRNIRDGYKTDSKLADKLKTAASGGVMPRSKSFYISAFDLLWTRSVTQEWRLCLPDIPLRRSIAAMVHVNTGHMLVDLTVFYVAKLFYWKNLRKDVESYIKTCRKCQENKYASGPTQGELKPREPSSRPWSSISIDFAQGFHTTVYLGRPVNALLVVVDRFTRWITLEPVLFADGHSNSTVIWEILERRVFSQNGNPEEIISDNDPRFQNDFEAAAIRRGIRLLKTPLRNPRANGLAEHHVKLTKLTLKALTGPSQGAWVDHIHQVEFALNNFPREALNGFTPFHVARGCTPRGGRFMWARVDTPNNMKRLMQQFQAIQGTAYDGMSEAAERMRELAQGSFRPELFKKDDQILVRRKALSDAEGQDPAQHGNAWLGPYTLLTGGDAVVSFQSLFSHNINRVSIKDVRRYYPPITELGYTTVPRGESETRRRIQDVHEIVGFDWEQKAVYTTWKHCHEWHQSLVAFLWLADLPFWRYRDLMVVADNMAPIPRSGIRLVNQARMAELAVKFGPNYQEDTRAPPGHLPVISHRTSVTPRSVRTEAPT